MFSPPHPALPRPMFPAPSEIPPRRQEVRHKNQVDALESQIRCSALYMCLHGISDGGPATTKGSEQFVSNAVIVPRSSIALNFFAEC